MLCMDLNDFIDIFKNRGRNDHSKCRSILNSILLSSRRPRPLTQSLNSANFGSPESKVCLLLE